MKELYRLLGIEGNFTTAYHPQTNGQTERTNQETESYLRIFTSHHQNDWHEWLPLAEFAYNDHEHSATKVTPFFADNGRHPYKGTAPRYHSENQSAQEFADGMKKVREEVGAALTKAKETMKRHYDEKRSEAVEYKAGDLVWLEGTNITTDRPMKKLGDKRFGPFKVIEKVGKSAYKLQIPKRWRSIHPVHNETLLTPYHKPQFPSQPRNTNPPPEVVGKELEYEVDEILDSRKIRGTIKYKVSWKGYGPHEISWEPVAHLMNAKEKVEEFHKKFPSKPRHQSLKRIEVPISLFPTHLFRPMPTPLTEVVTNELPTEGFLARMKLLEDE
jgi:hypothetical protein